MLRSLQPPQRRLQLRPGLLPVAAFCLAALGWAGGAFALDPADYTIQGIRERWHSRQEQVKSVRMNWREKRVFKTTHRGPGMWHGDPNSPGGFATIEYERQVQVDGDKIEYRSEAADAIRHNEAPLIRETFDGRRSQEFSVNSDNGKTGALTDEKYSYTGQSLPLFPLYWAFRPLHASMGAFNLESATILPYAGVIDEQDECLILQLKANDRSSRELWLDPKLELLPRRYVDTIDGIPTIKLDVGYAQDPKLGPLPNAWKFDWLDDQGQFFDSSEVTVTDYAINPSIPPEAFQIEFPEGTRVADATNGTRYVVGQISGPASDSRLFLVLLNVFILLMAIVVIVFLKRRSGKSRSS